MEQEQKELNAHDKSAERYNDTLQEAVSSSGFRPDYFYEYKIMEVHRFFKKRKIKSPLSILDFGCGIGNSIAYLKKYFPDAHIHGVDTSTESIKIAKEKNQAPNVSYSAFNDVNELTFDTSFDLIFVSCVFHHIPREKHLEILSFLKSCMNSGALLFIFEHNPYNPVTRSIFKKYDLRTDENANFIYPRYIKRQSNSAKFKVRGINYIVFFPKFLSIFTPLEMYMSCIPLGAQYFIVAENKLNPNK